MTSSSMTESSFCTCSSDSNSASTCATCSSLPISACPASSPGSSSASSEKSPRRPRRLNTLGRLGPSHRGPETWVLEMCSDEAWLLAATYMAPTREALAVADACVNV